MNSLAFPPGRHVRLLLAATGIASCLFLPAACKRSETSTGDAAMTAPPSAPTPGKVRGRWLRPDGGYVLEITSVENGGRAEAGYFNPNPVRVAWATVKSEAEIVKVDVELRDQNYPGCLYKLTYEPGKDRLVGTYFQAQMQQTYPVEFVRVP